MNFFYELLLLLALTFSDLRVTSEVANGHFINSWAAEIRGGQDVARQVAEQHGYRLVRSLDHLPDHYELRRSDTPHRSRRSADHHTRKLADDERVFYVEQQQHRERVKRDYIELNDAHHTVDKKGIADDPEFKNQWYLNQEDTTTPRRENGMADLRVTPLWERDINGAGVVLTIIDDGLEHTHSDLKRNYEPRASKDFNENDDDPMPRYEQTNENKHGTRCAGEISMVANNKICGTGIAHGAKIGGIKILDGPVTDMIESLALSFNRDFIHIYSSSWGPSDNGKTLEGPGKLTQKALEDGVKQGRNGSGSIFVIASGNGGASGDNCNCDGYTSSIYTISAGGASQYSNMPYYLERCASTLTTAFSSGSYSEGKVISADLHNKCTDGHSGTSAAAPMIAGVIALLLQVNPSLCWRSVQHILVQASSPRSLEDDKGWYRNGAGYCVNLAYGYGLIDAEEAADLAENWKGVGEQKICKVEPAKSSGFPQEFKSGKSVSVEFVTDGCAGQENAIKSLEHVQVLVDISAERRGNIYVELKSPSGTETSLMMERRNDDSKAGFKNWYLTSLHNWGEEPQGTWVLTVADRSDGNFKGSLNSAVLILYGTEEKPEHQKNIPKLCQNLNQYADTLTNVIAIDRTNSVPSKMHSQKQSYLSQNGHQDHIKISTQNTPEGSPHKSSVESLKEMLQSLSRG